MTIVDFSDQTLFPTFETCPTSSSSPSAPEEEWYLLAQVKDDMTITKPTLVLTDRSNAPFALVFDGLDRDGLDFKSLGLKKGCTAVIPRAVRTPPKEEGKRGFVSVPRGKAAEVRAIPGPLERVFAVGERLGMAGVSSASAITAGCESCGEVRRELMRCTGCGGARYCSKVCWFWTTSHTS